MPPKPLKNLGVLPGNPGNSGGKKGRSGRKPKSFATLVRGLHTKAEVQAAIETAAADHKSRGFGAVLKLMGDYDPEKPAQRIAIDLDRLAGLSDDELAAVVAAAKKAR